MKQSFHTFLRGPGTDNQLPDPYMQKKVFSWWERALLKWYTYTAPAYPGSQTSFQQQEAFRRGRLASLSLLVLIFVVVLFMAAIGITANINHPVFVTVQLECSFLSLVQACSIVGAILPVPR